MATIKELVVEYNDLGFGTIRSWKKPKAELQALIAACKREVVEVDNGGRLTVRQIAEEALLEVAGEDDNGNQLGHPYEEVLRRVCEFFPQAETSARSLAWYASKMRGAGMRVPYRPRAKRSQ